MNLLHFYSSGKKWMEKIYQTGTARFASFYESILQCTDADPKKP